MLLLMIDGVVVVDVVVVGVCGGDCCLLLLLWFCVAGRWLLVVLQKSYKHDVLIQCLVQHSTKKCKNTWFLLVFEKILDENS